MDASAKAGLILLGTLAIVAPAMAADIYVNTTADTNDGLCISALPCSLRDAVMIANANSEKDTIHLPAGVYELTILGSSWAEEGDLDITDDVDIVGAGAAVTIIDGPPSDNVFQIPDDEVQDGHPLLQLFDLTITGGEGAAVRSESAAFYLWRCVVEGFLSASTSPIYAQDTTVLVVDSVIRDNANGNSSGGVYALRSVLWALRSTIADNVGHEQGGAVDCDESSVTLTNATVTGNLLFGGTSGGIYGYPCDVLITGSTLAGNMGNDLELLASAATVRNSYIGSLCPVDTANQVTSEGGNVGSPNCGLNHASDIDFSGGTAILLPLWNYGGYIPTMPPRGTPNPLVDNPGADSHCLSDDQRGISRPQDGGTGTLHCDTGAVERTHVDLSYIFPDGFESGDTSAWSSSVP